MVIWKKLWVMSIGMLISIVLICVLIDESMWDELMNENWILGSLFQN